MSKATTILGCGLALVMLALSIFAIVSVVCLGANPFWLTLVGMAAYNIWNARIAWLPVIRAALSHSS